MMETRTSRLHMLASETEKKKKKNIQIQQKLGLISPYYLLFEYTYKLANLWTLLATVFEITVLAINNTAVTKNVRTDSL